MRVSFHESPLLSRSLALAILFGLVGVLLLGIVVPVYSSYVDSRNTVDQLRMTLSRLNVGDADLAHLKAEATRLTSAKTKTVGLLQSANDSLAAADLQNRLKLLVESVHGDLRSTQMLATRSEGNFRRVSIRSQIAVDVVGLQKIFYSLETSSPLLFLDNIDIRVRPDRKGGAANQGPLDVSFDVYGFMGEST